MLLNPVKFSERKIDVGFPLLVHTMDLFRVWLKSRVVLALEYKALASSVHSP